MTAIKKLSLLFILLISIGFTACCSCGDGEENIVKGIINVVGNEPFTRLAIIQLNEKVFLLDCNEELKKELWKQQGNYYAVQFSKTRVEQGTTVLVVEKAIPLYKNAN